MSVYNRLATREVRIGKVTIGGQHPVAVQSMTTANTRDVSAVVEETLRLVEAGCEIVRVTAPTLQDAHAIGDIRAELDKRGIEVPLVADVHHQGSDIAVAVAQYVDKVRINPGLFVYRRAKPPGEEYTTEEHDAARAEIEERLAPVIEACKKRDIAMRIGVNHGSLSDRMMVTYGDTPLGMVESALEFVRICEEQGFRNLVISLKASRVPVMIEANRLAAQRMREQGAAYPLHLGVTEAGDGEYARVKSTLGIGALLSEGIGDTIRVSLTEDPVNEVPVCYEILQGLGLRRTRVEYIACPSCGRTKFDLPTVLNRVRDATAHLAGLNIAVMGCLPAGERVVTPEGLVAMDTLAAGSQVLTGDGTFAPVTGLESHDFCGEVLEIKPRGAPPVRMTANHPVSALVRSAQVKSGRRRWENVANVPGNGHKPRWYAAGDVNRDFVLLYPVIQGEYAVERALEDLDFQVDESFLTLGACYVAEGSLSPGGDRPHQVFFHFGIHETELPRRLIEIFGRYGISASLRERATKNSREVIAHSTRLACGFARLFGRRAENKRLPPWMMTLPKTQQVTLLATLWSCDGYTGEVRGYPRATYVTVSPTLAFQVHQLLLRQGIAAGITERKPPNRQRVHAISVTNADDLRRFRDTVGFPIRVPDARRKTARMAVDQRYLYLPVQSIRSVEYHGTVHNLEVAGAHTYVGSLALVHNCIVNGPGEMADADYGYVGRAGGKIALYRGKECVKSEVPQDRGVDELVALIKADGRWVDPGSPRK
jgi:(E)-4-hydroxy-3-methylbut-2-enyl-diphosphate synthase